MLAPDESANLRCRIIWNQISGRFCFFWDSNVDRLEEHLGAEGAKTVKTSSRIIAEKLAKYSLKSWRVT